MAERYMLYVGGSGENSVLSEFLYRGYNVAVPAIDVGEDIFVIQDGEREYSAVQVKTATAVEKGGKKDRCNAQFTFPREQLVNPPSVDLTYVLALRRRNRWASFLVIPRADLHEMYRIGLLGKQKGKDLIWAGQV